MSLIILTKSPEPSEHPHFITIYKPIAGWKAVEYWWNPDMEGFWEPGQTGFSAWPSRELAELDAKGWAEAEDLPYYPGSSNGS